MRSGGLATAHCICYGSLVFRQFILEARLKDESQCAAGSGINSVCRVPLACGLYATVDAIDADRVLQRSWRVQKRGTTFHARTNTSRSAGKRRVLFLHRFILDAPDGVCVDHIDGNGLNNCRANLRLATHAQNSTNRRRGINNTSGFKGVYLHKPSGRWRGRIFVAGKAICLGYHDTPEAAHEAYKAASIKLHGAYGRFD
jgi:hypothetical protein